MLFGGVNRICLCEEGYTGDDCADEVPCPDDCNGNGKCKLGVCMCYNGWDGVDCSNEIEKWIPCEADCHGHGSCEDGVCVQCDEGWEGKFCQTKKIVVVKEDGSVSCPGEPECSSHGLCGPGGRCFCSSQWLGHDCSIKKCPDDCNGRGECKAGVCMCNPPYHSGALESCELIHCPNDCTSSQQGNCNQQSGKCACLPPWTTDDCSIQPCPGEPECSNQGQCDHQSGTCDCMPDFTGEDCSIMMRCPNDCSGNGVCFRGVCYCTSNFTGDGCNVVKRPPPPPGFDWEAPLRAAQTLFATSRTSSPPAGPTPNEFSIADKKELFKRTYGADWLRYWNLVHSSQHTRDSFVTAVTSSPPMLEGEETAAAVETRQRELFMKVFGETDFDLAWQKIMQNTTAKRQFNDIFAAPPGNYEDSATRGDGLPPPPPIARDPTASLVRQRLFTDTFGEGDGLAMEMMIFGDRNRRDLFTHAFSDFMKDNMLRDVQDKRNNWEDDMMQLMTDAFGSEGPAILREILADPERSALFRDSFAGYLEQQPTVVATLVQTEEGRGSDVSARRVVPPPV